MIGSIFPGFHSGMGDGPDSQLYVTEQSAYSATNPLPLGAPKTLCRKEREIHHLVGLCALSRKNRKLWRVVCRRRSTRYEPAGDLWFCWMEPTGGDPLC